MGKRVFLFTILSFCIYYGIAVASSGGVPPSASKKTSYKTTVKVKTVNPQPVKTPIVKEATSEKKAATLPVVTRPKKVVSRKESVKRPIDKARLRKARIIKQKRASLNNSKWDIEVMPLKGGEKTKDTVVFKDNKIAVGSLLDKGFSYTNYTLTVKDNGVLVWETMQTKTTGEVVFIRGEVASDITSMRGIISFPKGGVSDDYSFKSVSKQIIRR